MHEIRVRVPHGMGAEVAALAIGIGIPEASVAPLHLHGPDRPAEQVSVEVSTPKAKAFVDAVMSHERFDPAFWSITSRELRAIVNGNSAREITRPMIEPAIDVFEDLWQLSHVTPSYVGRAVAAALLLAYGMMEDNAVAIVVAALFLPFLSVVLAVSFGIWSEDLGLAGQGVKAMLVSITSCVAAGALVAALHGPPMQFHAFQRPLLSFGISAIVGVAAGLSTADDAGRRYLIGVAAAVQYAVFPVWFGTALVIGFPDKSITVQRLLTLAINVATIAVAGAAAYGMLGMRRSEVHRFVKSRFWGGR
jgi:Domain of unknown function (DUF389)